MPVEVLVLGNKFFGICIFLTTKVTLVSQAENIRLANNTVYVKQNRKDNTLSLIDENEIKTAFKNFEKYIDFILHKQDTNFEHDLCSSLYQHSISGEIIIKLTLAR